MDDFYIYVDRDGKMPQLRKRTWECSSHPYYVRYERGRPVAFHGPLEVVATRSAVGRLKFYDYAAKEFIVASAVPEE